MLVPALARWHDQHRVARRALRGVDTAVGHCVAETYSVLTRLPSPLQAQPSEAATTIVNVIDHVLVLDEAALLNVPTALAAARVRGGATYDGLVALTALAHGATLLTRDRRAVRTYAALGAAYELIT